MRRVSADLLQPHRASDGSQIRSARHDGRSNRQEGYRVRMIQKSWTCCLVSVLLASNAHVSSAQTCLGRPAGAHAKYSVGIGIDRRDMETSIIPRIGTRFGRTFVTIGAGPQLFRPHGERASSWHALIGAAFDENDETTLTWCPIVRMEYHTGYFHGDDAFTSGADTTVEAGLSIGKRVGRDEQRQVIVRGDAGVEHHLRRRAATNAIGDAPVNHLVVGTGISVIVRQVFVVDASIRASVESAIVPRYGFGVTIGWLPDRGAPGGKRTPTQLRYR